MIHPTPFNSTLCDTCILQSKTKRFLSSRVPQAQSASYYFISTSISLNSDQGKTLSLLCASLTWLGDEKVRARKGKMDIFLSDNGQSSRDLQVVNKSWPSHVNSQSRIGSLLKLSNVTVESSRQKMPNMKNVLQPYVGRK